MRRHPATSMVSDLIMQMALTPPKFELQGRECNLDSDLSALVIPTDHRPTRSEHGYSRRQMIPWCSLDNFNVLSKPDDMGPFKKAHVRIVINLTFSVFCILTFYVWFLLGLPLGFRVYSN